MFPPEPQVLASVFALELRVEVARPVVIDDSRRVVPITGGEFKGDNISGRILPGGADWQRVRPDGVTELEARYTLEADDGTKIGVMNRGLRHGPPEVMAQLAAGQAADPNSYYFRTVPEFAVPPGLHEWLARSIFVGVGERRSDLVVIRVFHLE
jgi:hypothetical protein